ncbi:PAS domain S-box-containing protein [Massilia sp. UYP11]|uniref:response regulator n=1 Tax=Massilia sp. UYP11 TaxID=1756385 RepID=UPI003D259378
MNTRYDKIEEQLLIADLRQQLQEAHETLDAIRNGEVDALLVGRHDDAKVYTLHNADRPYRFLIEQMSEGAMTLADDGIIVYGNSRIASIFGMSLEEIVGSSLQKYLSANDYEAVITAIRGSARDVPRLEMLVLRKDGSHPFIAMSIAEITSDTPNLRLFGVVVTDLTESRKVEERLRHAQKMEAVGQLTGGLAHDFNNLLQAVCGNLQLIKFKADDPARISALAQRGLDAAMRGAKLTAQLLAFSRLEQVNLQPVDITALISGMGDLFQHTLGPSVSVVYQLDQHSNYAIVDKTQLELALLNLAINARDAMSNFGTLTIRQTSAEDESNTSLEKWLTIIVSDTGSGMSPDVVSRAFDPFFTTKAVGQGTGLGLAQVYGIVRQAGGTVTIDSAEGIGTNVRIMLRRTVSPQPEILLNKNSLNGPYANRTKRVIVVDDDDDVRSFLVESLNLLGYSVSAATDGLNGLELIKMDPPDLAVVDYAMPRLSGSEMIKATRQAGIDIPVIFVTGYSNQSEIAKLIDRKTAILTKPFSLAILQEVLERLLDESKPCQVSNYSSTENERP